MVLLLLIGIVFAEDDLPESVIEAQEVTDTLQEILECLEEAEEAVEETPPTLPVVEVEEGETEITPFEDGIVIADPE